MAWRIEFADAALKELAKLDKPVARRIVAFLRERVAVLDDPRSLGEALKGSKLGRYRLGDCRIINIEDEVLRILVLKVGNRRDIDR